MLEAKGDETTDNLTETETKIPEGKPGSLLGFGVPLTADEHQGRGNGSLEYAKEDTGHQQTVIIVSSSATGSGDTPENDVGTKPLGGRYNLEKVSCEESCY